MTKIPDISKLTNKIDIQNFVKNIKSMITPGMEISEIAKDNNVLIQKLLQVTQGLKNLVELHTKQADEIAKLDNLVGSLYQDISLLNKLVANKEEMAEQSTKESTLTSNTVQENKVVADNGAEDKGIKEGQ